MPAQLAVGCAYRAAADGDAALGTGRELALAPPASLRVMHVVGPMLQVYEAGETSLDPPEINASLRADAERAVERRVASLSLRLRSLGGVSGQVIGAAACAVVVVPRRAHAALGSVFVSSGATEAR